MSNFEKVYVMHGVHGERLPEPVAIYVDAEVKHRSDRTSAYQLRLAPNGRGVFIFQDVGRGDMMRVSDLSFNGWLYGTGPRIRDWHGGFVGDDPMMDYRSCTFSDERTEAAFALNTETGERSTRQEIIYEVEIEIADGILGVLSQYQDDGATSITIAPGTVVFMFPDGAIVSGSPADVAEFLNELEE